jgi:hypothetical protein
VNLHWKKRKTLLGSGLLGDRGKKGKEQPEQGKMLLRDWFQKLIILNLFFMGRLLGWLGLAKMNYIKL